VTTSAQPLANPGIDALLPADSGTALQRVLRNAFSFPAVLVTALAATIFFLARRSFADPDIWWHLRNAEHLVTTRTMVRFDTYAFTTMGAPWINHEWLSELPYYFAWKWFGPTGFFLVLFLVASLILLGVFVLSYCTSHNVRAAFATSWIAIILATISFGPRTLLFGWLFFVLELIILTRFRDGIDNTWALPLLFVIWVNAHGSWLIGMVFLGIFVVSGLIEGKWGRIEASRWTATQRSRLFWIFGFCAAALFINPYTYHLVFYPFDLAFRQTLNVSHVDEWRSLDFHSLRGKLIFILLATTVILALVRKRRWRVEQVAFLLIGFYAALTYSRFLFLAAIVVSPLVAAELDFLPRYRRAVDRPVLNAVLICAILLSCAWKFPSAAYLMTDTEKDYPVHALSYLQTFHPSGPVFNDYLWGGYLIWNTRHIPVFIDSRVDIFEYSGVFKDYLDALGVKRPLEVLDKYHIQYVLYRKDTPLGYLLQHTPTWKTNYDDGTTILLERVGPA